MFISQNPWSSHLNYPLLLRQHILGWRRHRKHWCIGRCWHQQSVFVLLSGRTLRLHLSPQLRSVQPLHQMHWQSHRHWHHRTKPIFWACQSLNRVIGWSVSLTNNSFDFSKNPDLQTGHRHGIIEEKWKAYSAMSKRAKSNRSKSRRITPWDGTPYPTPVQRFIKMHHQSPEICRILSPL